MARPPAWWYTMQEARRQAVVAIDFYNRPGDSRSLLDFVVHMHLAWQNLLHADLMRRHVNIYFRERDGRRYRRRNGDKISWGLSDCLAHEFGDADPTRANVAFFIGLRNRIEHRFQDVILTATGPEAHANVLNFERELVSRFGPEHSLAAELRFPLFVQSLTPAGMRKQRELRRGLPLQTQAYITKFQAALDPAVQADERFAYRILLMPMKGPKTQADIAYSFVRQDELSEEELA